MHVITCSIDGKMGLIVDCNAKAIRLLVFGGSIIVGHHQRKFKITHVPCSETSRHIQGVSGGIVNILGGGSMNYSD